MSILTERKVWRKPRTSPRREIGRLERLPKEQEDNVREAARALQARYGSLSAVAIAMNVTLKTIENMLAHDGRPSIGLAFRIAQLASKGSTVTTEDVIEGRFPGAQCPTCGRCD